MDEMTLWGIATYPPPGRLRRPTSPARGEVHRVCSTRMWLTPALLHLLHIDANGAAAGESHLPRGLVGNAEFERLRLAALDHVERLGDHRALDAAAGDAAEEIAFIVDHQVRAHRPRRRTPGLDHGRERDPAALRPPVLGRPQDVLIARQHVHLHSHRA